MKCIIIDILSVLIIDTSTYDTVTKLNCSTQTDSFIEYQLLNEEHEIEVVSYDKETNVYKVKIKD